MKIASSTYIAPVIGVALFMLGVCDAPKPAAAINIVVDYRYDTNNFFDTNLPERRAAIEAAANRFSQIITTSLGTVSLLDNATDMRIGFTHPGTGASWDVSAAVSSATDALAGTAIAEEYRGPWTINADDWVLYAGGRSLTTSGQGGTGTGLNFTTVFTDGNSIVNRGFRGTGSVNNLPVWGGAITFDSDGSTNWHFDHTTASPTGSTDFYTIALHEIGHALGLSTNWLEWDQWSTAGVYSGPAAVAAYNADNGTAAVGLNEVSASNHHFQDGAYDSRIFAQASPNLTGTVGLAALQDLAMEPTANFTSGIRRFELTNVDVGALADIGWSVVVIPEPSSLLLLALSSMALFAGRTASRSRR